MDLVEDAYHAHEQPLNYVSFVHLLMTYNLVFVVMLTLYTLLIKRMLIYKYDLSRLSSIGPNLECILRFLGYLILDGHMWLNLC